VSFLKKIKKGSRKIHSKYRANSFSDLGLINDASIKTFGRLTGTKPFLISNGQTVTAATGAAGIEIPLNIVKTGLELWTTFCFPNDLRDFIYKQRQNSLWTNNRLRAAGITNNGECTFCRIRDNGNIPEESFTHIFWECGTTRGILNSIKDLIGENRGYDDESFTLNYWYGMDFDRRGDRICNKGTLLMWDLFRFRIWQHKLKGHIPNVNQIKKEISFTLNTMTLQSRRWREICETNRNTCAILRVQG